MRSNDEDKAGFLKTDNRVCVAISRAQHGFYMLGNMSLLSRASPLWAKLREKLVSGGNIGPKMQLRCGNHPSAEIEVESSGDFYSLSPEGGCKRICSSSMPKCNHSCPRTCHVIDTDHSAVDCKQKCPKILCPLQHPCPLLCYQKCEPCKVPVSMKLTCGHTNDVPCQLPIREFLCKVLVKGKQLPLCNHTADVPCSEDLSEFICPNKCDSLLSCQHSCKRQCHPRDDPNHNEYDCYEKCDRNPSNCSRNHPCSKKCYEDCGSCKEHISKVLKCGHIKQDAICSVPIDEIKCTKRCERKLDCSHPCPKMCGEQCGGCSVQTTETVPECGHKIQVSIQLKLILCFFSKKSDFSKI